METTKKRTVELKPLIAKTQNCATQKCKRPLTRLGPPWNCWICLECNTHPAKVNKMQKDREDEREHLYVGQTVSTTEFEKLQKQVEVLTAALSLQSPAVLPKAKPTEADEEASRLAGKKAPSETDEFARGLKPEDIMN